MYVVSKQDRQENELSKNCSKFPSKTEKLHHRYILSVSIAGFK